MNDQNKSLPPRSSSAILPFPSYLQALQDLQPSHLSPHSLPLTSSSRLQDARWPEKLQDQLAPANHTAHSTALPSPHGTALHSQSDVTGPERAVLWRGCAGADGAQRGPLISSSTRHSSECDCEQAYRPLAHGFGMKCKCCNWQASLTRRCRPTSRVFIYGDKFCVREVLIWKRQ